MWRNLYSGGGKCKFFLNTFFAQELQGVCDLKARAWEIHTLAYCYHWSLEDIKALSIKERKMWYLMVLKQKRAEELAMKGKDEVVIPSPLDGMLEEEKDFEL